jgi:peptidoglycan/LPS O-acetylase OafA/YrhL
MPGLDGLRALAVLAVIAYHEQFGWAQGGLLGVGVFFTLSGYLITDLLLDEWANEGRLSLLNFWARRARRLLPALFVMLTAVTAWVTIADRSRLASLRGAVAAAVAYVSNWYLIVKNDSYFARFAPPQPLDHLWSLAVEEQFYVLWPWLLLLGLLCLRRISRPAVAWLAIPTLALAAASAVAMLLLYHPGLDPTRVYEGTDTRACGLLVGAALAMIWPSRGRAAAIRHVWPADAAAAAGLVVVGLMIWRVGQYSPLVYRGGLVLLSLATAGIVAGAAVPGSLTGRVLGWPPLRWVGVRSYGIYLWHYPVIVLTSPANSGEDLPRAALQITGSVLLAALSWRFVEEPVRHGALSRLWAQARASRWRVKRAAPGTLATTAGAAGILVVAFAGLAGIAPSRSAGPPGPPAGSGYSVVTVTANQPKPGPVPVITGAPVPAPSDRLAPVVRTSCRAVAHIGDSTSEGMVMPDYLPDAAQRLGAQYHDVGVRQVRTAISGARSIVEVLPGQLNGYQIARDLVRSGFRGCWVIALGTNDTANVAVGSSVGFTTRINEMMSVARGEPVMWVNVKSLLAYGPYAESNMEAWNAALLRACGRYPNLRIFDWAAVARTSWFISDGIHYTSQGYAARAQLIARALAEAFPSTGQSTTCSVS